MIPARPIGILAELDIEHPMLLVLDAPVAAHRVGEPYLVGERTQVIAAFSTGFVPTEPAGVDPADGPESGPLGFRRQPPDLLAKDLAADLDAARALLHRLRLGQPAPCGFRIQPQAHLLTQGGMIVL